MWVEVELVRVECVWCCQRQLRVNVVEGRLHVEIEIELRFLELVLEVELELRFLELVLEVELSGAKARVDTLPGFRRASICEES